MKINEIVTQRLHSSRDWTTKIYFTKPKMFPPNLGRRITDSSLIGTKAIVPYLLNNHVSQ